MNRFLFLFLLLSGFSLSLIAQENPEISHPFSVIDQVPGGITKIDTAVSLAQEEQNIERRLRILKYAENLNLEVHDTISAKIWYELSGNYLRTQKIDSALIYVHKILIAADLYGTPFYKIKGLNVLAHSFSLKGEFDSAVYYYKSGLEVINANEGQKYDVAKADLLGNLSGVFGNTRDYESARKYNEEALELARDKGGDIDVAYGLVRGMIIENEDDHPEKGIELGLMALQKLKKVKDSLLLIFTYSELGAGYVKLEDWSNARHFLERGERLAREIDAIGSYTDAMKNLVKVYLEEGSYLKAELMAQEVLDMGKETGIYDEIHDGLIALYEIALAKKNFEKALELKNSMVEMEDSLLNKETKEKIAQLQTQYETAEKDREIEDLEQEAAFQKLAVRSANERLIWFAIVLLIMLVVGVIIYRLSLQRARVNKELQASNATKDKFFSIIAHDLKNPLSAFGSITQGLLENHKEIKPDDLEYFLSKLSKSSGEINNLLKNLLEWALSQSGSLNFQPASYFVKDIVRETVQPLMLSAEVKGITLDHDEIDDVQVFADRPMVLTILRNLVSNAVKFTPNGGQIHISGTIDASEVQIIVQDNGVGITKKVQGQLFQLGENFQDNGSQAEAGTGLGLVLCRELVEKNKGRIWVISESGKGSKFIFTLPLGKIAKEKKQRETA